jgi:predicted nucleic acid-binding protein
MILCDTNILIEIYRNNSVINAIIDTIGYENIAISDVTRAEILVGARNKREMNIIRKALNNLKIIPINTDISSLSIDFIENFYLSNGLDFHDALIAATAIICQIELYTLNLKHFNFIPNLNIFHST